MIRKISLLLILVSLNGCNFFGKQEDPLDNAKTGQLSTGVSVLGTWSTLVTSTSATRNPNLSLSYTYIFTAASTFQVKIKELHNNGTTCMVYGAYRISGDVLQLFVQTATGSGCYIASTMKWKDIRISSDLFQYFDMDLSQNLTLYKSNTSTKPVLVGLWDFNKSAGIDYILFDENGYFILQAQDSGSPFLVWGSYYMPSSGGLYLQFRSASTAEILSEWPFNSFITDGTQLQLTEVLNGSNVNYLGIKL